MILASDDGHKKVFPDVPMIGFKNNKNLKAHLVRSQLPDLDEVGRSKPCGGKRPPCHLCENMKDTCTFKSKHLNEVHKINKKYNCNSKMAVYLIEWEICGEQYTGSTKTKFRSRANNYKSTQRKFVNKEAVPKQALKQKRFHEHYCSDRHNGIEDWVITLIDSADTLKELRRKEVIRRMVSKKGMSKKEKNPFMIKDPPERVFFFLLFLFFHIPIIYSSLAFSFSLILSFIFLLFI